MDRAPKRTPGAIHIPPDEAVAFAVVALEVAFGVWQRQRMALSMRMFRARRNLEFALEHDHGFTMLIRDTFRRRS